MSALINKTTLAPGETVGLLDLTGATPGTLYTVLTQANGVRIVTSPDSEESYPLDDRRAYVTDTEILVKNTSNRKRSVRAVAFSKGTGGSTGTTAVGETVVGPGETVGLLETAGATPGTLFSVSALGDRLGVVSSESREVSFELENNRVYVTNEEILVRNLTNTPDRISVLAIPTIEAVGSGGGGGDTPTLNEVLAAGASSDTPVTIVYDENNNVEYGGGMTIYSSGPAKAYVGATSFVFQDNEGQMLYVTPQTGPGQVTIPAATGTLVVTPPVPTTGTYTLQSVDGVADWVAV